MTVHITTLSSRPAYRLLLTAALSLPLIAGALSAHAQTGAPPSAQSSSQQGVTVKVTPRVVGAEQERWQFAVVLDTHSSDLDDDLTQTATLVTDDGREIKPAAWSGAGPGGHHREGVLEFDMPAPRPAAVELRLQRRGEATPRLYRWQF